MSRRLMRADDWLSAAHRSRASSSLDALIAFLFVISVQELRRDHSSTRNLLVINSRMSFKSIGYVGPKNRPSDREMAKIRDALDEIDEHGSVVHAEWLKAKQKEKEDARRKEMIAREKEAEAKKQLERDRAEKRDESLKEWRERKAVERLRPEPQDKTTRLNSARSSLSSSTASGFNANPYLMYSRAKTRSKQDMTSRTTLSAKSESTVHGG